MSGKPRIETEPLRLIYTTNFSPWSPYSGGGQRSAHELATVMAARGHDVHLIATRAPFESIPSPKKLPYSLHWAPLYHPKSSRNAPLRPLSAFGIQRIASRLTHESRQPAVIHVNGEEGSRIGVLKTSRRFLFVATPRYPHYPPEIGRWEHLSAVQRGKMCLTQWKHVQLRTTLLSADLVCPPSRWAAETVRDLFGLESSRVEPVGNGVPSEFTGMKRRADAKRGPILFFGRLSRDKGVDLLLEAYARLPEPCPELWIAGEGEEKHALQNQAARLGIRQRVRFYPWQSHKQLAELLTGAAMAVLPSRRENYSLAVLASLACGTPTISTDAGGTPEQILSEENGLLVPNDRTEPLLRAMRRLLADPAGAEEMGRRAALRSMREQTWKSAGDRFEQLYRLHMANGA